MMNMGNVLVIGSSGVGKSTLINAVLGEEVAETGWGTKGTTKELDIYESSRIPFRIIDTVGFEPSLLKELKANSAVRKWSRDSAKAGHEDNQVNVIWFCVEGTSSKLFPKQIENLSRATTMWASVPVIVVITKSYSVPDRDQNIEMVHNAFAKQRRYAKNLRGVIPVVASTYVLNEGAFAAPEGITELIDATHALMPEGIRAGEADIAAFKLNRKRALAHGVTGVSTTAAVVVGALKAIPGVNLGASALNAITAGTIVAALGEGTIYAFEQVYLGKRSITDIDWVKKMMESKFSSQMGTILEKVLAKISSGADKKVIASIVMEVVKSVFGGTGSRK